MITHNDLISIGRRKLTPQIRLIRYNKNLHFNSQRISDEFCGKIDPYQTTKN